MINNQLTYLDGSGLVSSSKVMVASSSALEERKTSGTGEASQHDGTITDTLCRGAYCSMTIISLLGLPLDLPPDAPARATGSTSFLSGLPEYLSRCQCYYAMGQTMKTNFKVQARRLREGFLAHHRPKLMAPMRSALWHACACLGPLRR